MRKERQEITDKGRGMKNQRFPWRLIVIFLILASGIGVSGYFYYHSQKNQFRARVAQELLAIADLKVSEIEHWRKERLEDARLIQENAIVISCIHEWQKSGKPPNLGKEIRAWLNTLQESSEYTTALLLNTSGEVMLTSDRKEPLGSYARKLAFSAMKTRKITFSDLHQGETGHGVHFGLLVPLFLSGGQNGPPAAILLLRIDPASYLYPLIQGWPTPSRSAETLLVKREGDDVVFLNELRHRKNTALTLRIPITKRDLPASLAVTGKEGIVEGNDYRGLPVIAALRSVPGFQWYLVSKVDAGEIYAHVSKQIFLIIIAIFGLIALTGTVLILMWRHQISLFFQTAYEREVQHTKEIEKIGEELQESEEQFRAMFDVASIGIAQADVHTGQFLRMNQKMCTITGYSSDEMLRMRVAEITHPEDKQRDWEAFQRVVRGEAPDYRMEKRYVRKDGTVTWVNVNMTIIRDATGRPLRTMATIEDITERKQMEQQILRFNELLEQQVQQRTAQLEESNQELEASNKELEAFTYTVSHDFRAPLRHLAGFAELLKGRSSGILDEKTRHYIDVLQDSATHMGYLIDDLLDFSRIGRAELIKTNVSPEEIIKEVMYALSEDVKGREIAWNIHQMSDVYGDRSMLKLVFQNLISNALKFTSNKDKAEIEIGYYAENPPRPPLPKEGKEENIGPDKEMVFYVKDNGAGFDMQYVDKLFNVFQRLHRKDEFRGTGIGLANVRRIIQKHRGRVWAEGKVGEGATFFFTLPGQ